MRLETGRTRYCVGQSRHIKRTIYLPCEVRLSCPVIGLLRHDVARLQVCDHASILVVIGADHIILDDSLSRRPLGVTEPASMFGLKKGREFGAGGLVEVNSSKEDRLGRSVKLNDDVTSLEDLGFGELGEGVRADGLGLGHLREWVAGEIE